MPASDRPLIKLGTINMDCRDSQPMADFYGALLGWEIRWRDGDFIILGNPEGGPDISFQPYKDYEPPVWPEQPGALWKMIHFDMPVSDLDVGLAHALSCGARLADFQGRDDLRVLLDPAGHPFCIGVW
jgi:catechol 2,3-dioxygenase-like lactoylglutathione lyase family enzyme